MVQNQQKGRSMIEMLGVLAIIGVLSAGGVAGYSAAMESYKVNKTLAMLTETTHKAMIFFDKVADKNATVASEDLCELNILPSEVCNNGKGYFGENVNARLRINKVETPLSVVSDEGNLNIYGPRTAVVFDFSSAFSITACAKILSHQSWFDYYEIAITVVKGQNNELPLSPELAASVCESIMEKDNGYFSINLYPRTGGIEAE